MKLQVEVQGKHDVPTPEEMDQLIDAVALAQKQAETGYHHEMLIDVRRLLIRLKEDLLKKTK
jgi:hypothetical protein